MFDSAQGLRSPWRSSLARVTEIARIAVVDSTYFAFRRACHRWFRLGGKRDALVLVLDLDHTLWRANFYERLIQRKLGRNQGSEFYRQHRDLVAQGRCSPESAHLLGYRQLFSLSVTQADYDVVTQEMIDHRLLRTELIDAARSLQSEGAKIVIATKGPQCVAERLANQHGFDLGLGTEEVFHRGILCGISRLMGNTRGTISGVPVTTKLQRLQEAACTQWALPLKRRQIHAITDGYDDIALLRKVGTSILLVPPESDTQQRIAQRFALADIQLLDGPSLGSDLRRICHGHPEPEVETAPDLLT